MNNQNQTNLNKGISTPVGILIIVICLLLAGGILVWQYGWLAKEEAKPPEGEITQEDETANWEIYRNEEYGFEVKYPSDIFQLDVNKVTLSHTLKNFHMYSKKDGSDLGLAGDISITFKKDTSQCDELKSFFQKYGEEPEAFNLGNIEGDRYYSGAEGEGIFYYCVKEKGVNTFLIERWSLHEAYSLDLSEQEDYIPSQEQGRITNQMLSTFRFLE